MNRDELCPVGTVFVEDKQYALSRYNITEQGFFFEAWNETFDKSPLINDVQFKKKSWEDVLVDANKLQLKIVDKLKEEYIGEVMLVGLETEMPEIGIQLLRRYQGQGIGTHIVRLFFKQLKSIIQAEFLKVRICSDNYISQRMFEKLGAIKIGEEGKEYAELMKEYMRDMGKEKFEKIIEDDFESTQKYIICYKVPLRLI